MVTHYYVRFFERHGAERLFDPDTTDIDEAEVVAKKELEEGLAVRAHIENAAGEVVKVIPPM